MGKEGELLWEKGEGKGWVIGVKRGGLFLEKKGSVLCGGNKGGRRRIMDGENVEGYG